MTVAKRTICVVTGTRAEYGLLSRLMKEIQQDGDLVLQIIATGMHLSPEFGLTYKLIEQDGFCIDAKVEMLLSSDTPVGIAKSIGLGVIGFADALDRLKPDIMVVLGDRFEILAAVQAALVARIPVAHIHGGEVTEGAIDEAIRHAITKMTHLHFAAAEEYAQRIIQLGEQPCRVFTVGAPGLDAIAHTVPIDRTALETSLGFAWRNPLLLVTYHPVTLAHEDVPQAVRALCSAIEECGDISVIFTKANADTDGRIINAMIDNFVALHPERMVAFTTMGHTRYISAMRYADVVVGNSSSGIIEAPFVKTATVNIGKRQHGRLRATSIIDCGETKEEITAALQQALSPEFRATVERTKSLYGTGEASHAMKNILKKTDIRNLVVKQFYDNGHILQQVEAQ